MLPATKPLAALRSASRPQPLRGHPSAIGHLLRAGAIAALLAAILLRALPLMQNRFHPDEALYASFARYAASGDGSLLSRLVVDKPPLSFYLNGLSVLIFGGTEFAVRLPNLFASVVSVALLWALARRLYDARTGLLAAWLLALSPFAILFSVTVFIDPLLTAFVLAGLWAACAPAPRPRLAALFFTLAYATKQTALLYLPLGLACTLIHCAPATTLKEAARHLLRVVIPILIGLALVTAALFVWDWARQAPIGLWEQGYSDNAPGRFVRANEVWPRALAWLEWMQYFTASRPLDLFFLLTLPLLLGMGLIHPSRAALADFILAGYLLLHLAAYWLLAFNIWDRYLLPLLPLAALLLARSLRLTAYGLSRLTYRLSHSFGPWPLSLAPWPARLLPPAFCLLLLSPALTAARSGYPVGGDHGAYDGIDDVARFVRSLPPGGVLYDHWLGWEFNFYLFDRPLYISYFPAPEALTTDLLAFGRASPRYLVVPSWEADAEVRVAAGRAGFAFAPIHAAIRRDGSTSFVVYQLVPSSP
jgi:4-amino-4-deoxy-L-arabinose transferase-like glycosyltransferase